MTDEVRSALAPTGTLRAGINMGNFLLVTGKAGNGDPTGVSPSMAAALASRLGVPVSYLQYESPGVLADAATDDVWDVGNIGAEPARAESINFTAAYVEIEATYLVRGDSPLRTVADVDKAGVRIAVSARSAYDLWLTRTIKHAELVRVAGLEASFNLFVDEGLDALAGLRPRLVSDVERIPGARIMEERFSAVQQAMGVPKSRGDAAFQYVRQFVEEAKASGLVASLIEQHQVRGLSVAAPA
ncbi:MAG: transporter substrate-binding domain-containing protein [Gammaproteobacteria bacterium]|nr:transporter substrate-binding domain-containing protein [Gammaproteobacteria bacterium]